MQEIALKILVGLALKLFTEKFVARTVVRMARSLSAKTTNTLDDGLVNDLADALGQTDLQIVVPAVK